MNGNQLQGDENQAIRAFWAWWKDNQDAMEKAIGPKTKSLEPFAPFIEPISALVEAIHPNLTWEMGKSASGGFELCVTGELDLSLRVLAERWRVAGPALEGWSFVAARQPTRGSILQYAGRDFDPEELGVHFQVDEHRERVHAVVTHPAFSEMDENHYGMAAFLMFNMWFGEDGIMNWLGAIEALPASEVPGEVRPWKDFDAAVEHVKANATGEQLIEMKGETEDGPVFVVFNPAVKPLNHLLMDMCVEVHIPWALTGNWTFADLDRLLDGMEHQLLELLGHQAVFIARETRLFGGPEDPCGMRIVHLHISGLDSALSHINAWADRDDHLPVEVKTFLDVDWAILTRWRF